MSVSLYGSGNTVIQVQSTTITTQFSTTSTSFVDITGFNVSITPQSTTSKILIMVNGYWCPSPGGYTGITKLVRNSTDIDVGTVTGSSTPGFSGITSQGNNPQNGGNFVTTYLDSPATTPTLTYKIQVVAYNAGSTGTIYINRSSDTTSINTPVTSSTITVMEIAYA